jgi:NAD-dependent dihydropyrimidine dehydrogenase PreA subunit
MTNVAIDAAKCTGDAHCRDVCPVNVFEIRSRTDPAFASVVDDPAVAAKFKFRGEKAVVLNGSDCIVCEACLFECEGECITITDDENNVRHSHYK